PRPSGPGVRAGFSLPLASGSDVRPAQAAADGLLPGPDLRPRQARSLRLAGPRSAEKRGERVEPASAGFTTAKATLSVSGTTMRGSRRLPLWLSALLVVAGALPTAVATR